MSSSLFNTELGGDTRNLALRINQNSKKSIGLFVVGFFFLFVNVWSSRTALVREGPPPMVIFMINYKNHRAYNTKLICAP